MEKKYPLLLKIIMFCMLVLSGCSKNVEVTELSSDSTSSPVAPFYERETSQFNFEENANTYMVEYGPEGMYYFVMGYKEAEDSDTKNAVPQAEYQFFYQPYGEKEASPFCTITEGAVRDFSSMQKADGNRLAVLVNAEEACILEFDESGKECERIVLDKSFNDYSQLIHMLALPDDKYAVSMGKQVYLIDKAGKIEADTTLDGIVSRLFTIDGSEMYVLSEQDGEQITERHLLKLDTRNLKVAEDEALSNELIHICAFQDGLASVYKDRVVYSHMGQNDERDLIDLDRQSIMASEIKHLYEENGDIRMILLNDAGEALFISLHEKADGEETQEESKEDVKKEEELYTEDGRRIVRVVVPEDYPYQIEFHAKKYNQVSDKTYVKVERITDSMELYLGKGNRPDVIMVENHTELDPYIEKNALVNLIPLFDNQDQYSLDDIIEEARAILNRGDENTMYAMAPNFRMLLYFHVGEEFGTNGENDIVSYLKWYNDYMIENSIWGLGKMERLEKALYANMGFFYDEDTIEVSFMSEEFKELMDAYKECFQNQKVAPEVPQQVRRELDLKPLAVAYGPFWMATYAYGDLADPDIMMEGIPGVDGKNQIIMILDYPMGILNTSECKEEAFDFMMYYNTLDAFLRINETEGEYKKGAATTGRFSVYESLLNELIFETTKCYTLTKDGELFFTPEQKEQLWKLIHNSVPDTKTQRDIYAMCLEEMSAYWNGDKDFESACEILENRVILYLEENK